MDLIGTDHTRPHVPNHVCGKCRKEFEQGDRLIITRIFDKKGFAAFDFSLPGAYVFEEYEFVHVDCRDPKLVKGLIT